MPDNSREFEQEVSKQSRYAYVELFSANYNRIKSFIFTMIPNNADAEDIMQETARVTWEKFDQFTIGTSFISWATTIAKYQVMSYRKNKRPKILFSEKLIDLLANEAESPIEKDHERLSALRDCIKRLNTKDRKLLHFRFEDQISAKKLSQRIGVAMNTIYRNESRILALLLRCIRKNLGMVKA